MKTEFRNRALLPVVIPLAIVGTIAVLVGSFAMILLYNSRFTAVVLAIVAAAGILIAMTIASSRDKADGRVKGAVALAGGTPIVLGLLVAVGVIGGLAPEDLNINRQPHTSGPQLAEVPEDAPLLAAESLNSFCLPSGGTCEETNEWEIPADAAADETFIYAFDNRDTTTGPHNLVLFTLEGSADDATAGDLLFEEVPAAFDGPETRAYQTSEALPEQFYFLCTIHPNTMWGVGTVAS
jgi:hypothetical protein